MSKGCGFVAFIAGAITGAVAGLLLAPRSGAENRAILAEKFDECVGQSREAAAQGVEKLSENAVVASSKIQGGAVAAGSKIQETAAGAVDWLGNAVESVKPRVSESRDELRAKMDAARQRINEQVAKNIEQSEVVVEEAAEALAEEALEEEAE